MTNHDPEQQSFESLLDTSEPATAPAGTAMSRGGTRRAWIVPAATIGLAILGVGVLAVAALLPPTADAAAAPSETKTVTPSPTATPSVSQVTPTNRAEQEKVTVAERADPEWVTRIAAGTGIPERALAAYAGASLAVTEQFPTCHLGWNTLAAIGHVESEHGTLGGSRIGRDGVAAPRIIGIPLDGNETQQIRDTDGGALDDDTVWDRAVGPMQFIPDTWNRYAQDGNGDGKTDVHQIDDAALSAAVYLCTAGGDLSEPSNWIVAIDAYNPSVAYNNRVAEAANHYASVR